MERSGLRLFRGDSSAAAELQDPPSAGPVTCGRRLLAQSRTLDLLLRKSLVPSRLLLTVEVANVSLRNDTRAHTVASTYAERLPGCARREE